MEETKKRRKKFEWENLNGAESFLIRFAKTKVVTAQDSGLRLKWFKCLLFISNSCRVSSPLLRCKSFDATVSGEVPISNFGVLES